MDIKLNPKIVRVAVFRTVDGAVDQAMGGAVDGVVVCASYGVMDGAVPGAMYWAMYRAVHIDHPHPNLDRFLAEVRQARGDAA